MKKILLSTIAITMMLSATAQPTTKTVKLKVVETSDVHGHFFPYDFMEKKPIKGTLSRANTYINKEREKYGKDHFLLIDNGDILQGQPCVYWSNYVMPENENLAASVINYMQYDAETVGNHDIEPGHKVYDKWIREVRCPLLGANIVKEGSDGTANPKNIYTGLQPYSIHYIDGVKIAIIGMLTPAIPNWLTENVWKGMEFEEMTSCAKKWIKYLKEVEHPDLIFGLFHSGKDGGIVADGYEENATAAVAREVPGFDIIFFGHDHQVHNEWITNKEGQQVLIIDPSCYVKNVAEAEIELTFNQGKLVNKDIKGEIVSVLDEQIDEQMVSHFQKDIDAVKTYVDRKIGRFENSIYTRESFFGNSAFTDLIHELQLKITGADISITAPLSFNSVIHAGDVTVSDMFKLYRFENLLLVLRMTGEELLKDEDSEDQQRAGFKYYTFNFDSACGIDYEVDVTKPDGEKVKILRMSNGEPFDEKKWYKVAMNSYRANGGGELLTHGAGIPKDSLTSRVIYCSELDQRHYLMEEIERQGTINPQPHSNWKFIPEEWAKPALERDRILLFGK